MALTAGTLLGPYEIVAPLGAGGMGEVYRARDTRLDRSVALKILPTHLSADPHARMRFDREARAISSLSHPNICQLYDVGHQDGIDFLVMEFLEGETLAERIVRGPIPTEQLLRIGCDVCDGLERAHKSGVVHRDLKPANVMLTKSGAKLMDFGLAKAVEAEEGPVGSLTRTLDAPGSAAPLTQAGVVVGTFQYMSPEQVEGKPADARSDIFSFGAVLYEMATGKRAFDGKTSASVIAAILEREPAPISSVQPASPPALERLVRSCLAKDPDDRWQTAHDVKLQLQSLRDAGSQAGYSNEVILAAEAAAKKRTTNNRSIALVLLGTMAASAIVFGTLGYALRSPKPAAVLQASITLPANLGLTASSVAIALSPDGQKLAVVAVDEQRRSALWVRSMDSQSMQMLPGTDDAQSPFWSPDSRSIGFFTSTKLARIDLATGTVTTLCDAPSGRGGSWGSTGTILFAPANIGGLSVVPATGGSPMQVTTGGNENGTDRLPWFLPDGEHALYVHGPPTSYGHNTAVLLDVRTREAKTLFDSDSEVIYVEPGYLLYMHAGNLLAQQFNARQLAVTGQPMTVAQDVTLYSARRAGFFTAANSGLLLYRRDPGESFKQLEWFDVETGKELAKVGDPARISEFSVSPDDQHMAATIATTASSAYNAPSGIWLYDLARGTASRFTFAETAFREPTWTPDGKTLLYEQRGEIFKLYEQSVNGDSQATLVPTDGRPTGTIGSVTPDGQWVSVHAQMPRNFQIDMIPLVPDKKIYTFLAPNADARDLSFSPDGKWAAYLSNETGRYELYASSFPGHGGRWQISKEGAIDGGWLKQPGKLGFVGFDGKLYEADATAHGEELAVGDPQVEMGGTTVPGGSNTFTPRAGSYVSQITRDGKRILLAVPVAGGAPETLTLNTNWIATITKP